MIASIFILALLHIVKSTCITYEQRQNFDFSTLDNPNFLCQNGLQHLNTIQFSQEFCASPKILIHKFNYHTDYQSSFSFKITTITTTHFQVQLKCDSLIEAVFVFYWVAIINKNILILNDFMQSITLIDGYRTNLIPYTIQTIDYEISIQITSYSGGSPNITVEKQANGFNLYVTGVNNTALNGLGVQIMAGKKSVYNLFQSISNNCQTKNKFVIITPFLPTQIPIIGYQNNYEEINQIYAKGFFVVVLFQSGICQLDHFINLNLYIYECTLPHYYKKIRVSNKMCFDRNIIGTFDTQKLFFQEANETWIDSNNPIATLEYKQAIMSLVYYYSCQPNRKIVVTILRIGKQGEYDYTQTFYCHRLYNLITIYIYFLQERVGLSEFQFNLTDKGVQIEEKVINTGDTYQILNIQY